MKTVKLAQSLSIATLAWLLAACGGQQFTGLATTQQADAPGAQAIAPKVDILLAEDDTGAMLGTGNSTEPYQIVESQTQSFLNGLNQKGWDFHFAAMPLTHFNALSQATASDQDCNYSLLGNWESPFPGANCNSLSSITLLDSLFPSVFESLSGYSGYLTGATTASYAPGFETIRQMLSGGLTNTGFIRSDAMLAVIVVAMGNDTSYVNYCYVPGGGYRPCEDVANTTLTCPSGDLSCVTADSQPRGYDYPSGTTNPIATGDASFAYYASQFLQAKQVASQVRFYSVVADSETDTGGGECLFANSTVGTRYQWMAGGTAPNGMPGLNGQSYNICQSDSNAPNGGDLTDILSDIASNLTVTSVNFEQDYIKLNEQPNPATIQLVEYPNGNTSDPVTIAEDPSNGWTYVGYTTVDLISEPTPMDQQTGYMIQLHGSAILIGSTTAAVTYKTPSGASGD